MNTIDIWIKTNPKAWAEIIYDLSFSLGFFWNTRELEMLFVFNENSMADSRTVAALVYEWGREFVEKYEIPAAWEQNKDYDYITTIDTFCQNKINELKKENEK